MHITKKKVVIILVLAVIISNFFPVFNILHLAIDEQHYRYSNGDGSITCTDEIFKSGGNCKLDSNSIKYYKQKYHREPDPNFYRLFWRNPLCFWRWKEYFTDKRYEMPNKSWSSILKIKNAIN